MFRRLALITLLLLTAFGFAATRPTTPPVKAPATTPPPPAVRTLAAYPFTVSSPEADFVLPEIVLQYDPAATTGADWAKEPSLVWYSSGPDVSMMRAAEFLREGIRKMTGKELPVASTNELSKGIILTTLAGAPADLRNDPDVRAALKNNGKDGYNDREAFFIRTEKARVAIVANTPDGLADAVVELLDSVDYEILGMGPDWISVPDYTRKPLVFNLKYAGRPSYYSRNLWPTSGQSYGVGTLIGKLTDPADEPVDASWRRWQMGASMMGASMPGFPGHAMQGYHARVLAKMRETGATDGFLVKKMTIGATADRPVADKDNAGQSWIDSVLDPQGNVQAYLSDGKTWVRQNNNDFGAVLDQSVPLVRNVILDAMKKQAAQSFTEHPDDVVILATEPEDGGCADMGKLMKYKNWYPDYLKAEGLPWGRPYVLNGYQGYNHPKETWDFNYNGDTIFGFDNWLLHEMDKWIDTLPEKDRVTATGKSKKALLRCSQYSYNYHDVPPDFNLDSRIRVMIAGYPKHRGRGRWPLFATQQDVAKAYQVMLPREPSGDYRIISLAYYWDPGTGGIPAAWSASPQSISADLRDTYAAGIKALSVETDFNFGKFGLAYYLIGKMLWNTNLTAQDLDKLRDRWFQRAYGSAWKEMKTYYDFMLKDNYPINGPNTWAKAIRMIDTAQQKLDPAKEPEAQRRLDDLKQYWYFHYLEESNQAGPDSKLMREYVWKGQMSYMVAMHMAVRRHFGDKDVPSIAGPEFSNGPAHYTHEETQQWWTKVLDFWKLTPVTMFYETLLANERPAKTVDLNDLVAVKEFQGGPADAPFSFNSYGVESTKVATVAVKKGDLIGFKLFWPFMPEQGDPYNARKVAYGVDLWNPAARAWQPVVGRATTQAESVEVKRADGRSMQVVTVSLPAPAPGAYRFDIGPGGYLANLAGLGCDPATRSYTKTVPFTYLETDGGLTQGPLYFYIPKGAKTLDFEVYDTYKSKTLVLYTGLPTGDMRESRKIDCGKQGTYTIALQPGEAGTVAMFSGNGFVFPYLYSVYSRWAKSPAALLVPRGIALSDNLTF